MTPKQLDRALLFVDGNNWYHALKSVGVTDLGQLNYAKVSKKLILNRQWVGTRYYVGQIQQRGNTELYAAQRKYMSWLLNRDPKMSVYYGRIESRQATNEAAKELREYLGTLRIRIDPLVYKSLQALAKRHEKSEYSVEKAVDVMLAVDMVESATRDEYDTAFLLAADGDYTPAVEAVKNKGKRVLAASVANGAELAKVVHSYIHLPSNWVNDCFGP